MTDPQRRKVRILLAEDNAVNQKVALRILEKNGYRADLAANGQEALEAMERISYDLVLMDVQMPEMDGMEASRAIRKREESTHRHVPIIAMTAHAMPEDRQRCLNSGMDDYVSKPIQPKNLIEVIDRVLSNFQKDTPEKSKSDEIFDKASLLEVLDGDEELLKDILKTFLEDTPLRIAELKRALQENDSAKFERNGHSLKGAALNVRANRLQASALQAELAGKSDTLAEAGDLIKELEREFNRFEKEVADLVRK